jgi:DNA-binding IclR family transcriptional regulator
MKRPKAEYSIQTVSNALAVLAAFADEEELGVTELSSRLDLHKNNVFRLLATLENAGYVEQCSRTDRYRLGVRCLEVGRSFARNSSLVRQARPLLEELAEETGESAHLGVLREFEVIHLDGEVADRLVRTSLRVGRRLPAHCTALGKVLLGFAPKGVQETYDRQMIATGRLDARTPSTVTDSSKLLELLRTVVSQGHATDVEECEPGLCCAAAPIFDASGRLAAALSISGPVFRLPAGMLQARIVPLVVAAADRLSQGLGSHPL